jgi:glycosyltransferase involved in cell wall biosynthesis
MLSPSSPSSPSSPTTPTLRTFAGPLGRIRRRTATLVMDLQLRRATATICISPYVGHLLGPRLAQTHIVRIDNPVDPVFFDLPPAPGGATILSVATIGEIKNQLLLVRAFGQLSQRYPAARLVLAGPTADAAYQARVETLIGSLGLGGRVHLVGQAAPDTLQRLYIQADILALSSIQETAPLAVAQAMAAGRPVVATDVGGLRWLVDDQRTGLLVPSQDTDRLARALAALLDDPDRRRAMGQRARAVARDRFHPAQVAAQTLDVYQHVIPHPAPEAARCAC